MTYCHDFSERSRLDQFLRVFLAIVCGYELSALVGLPAPTISYVVRAHRHVLLFRVVVWALLGFLAWHLLVETQTLGPSKPILVP